MKKMDEKINESLEKKLDVLISLTKIQNSEKIEELQNKVESDPTLTKILEYSNGTMSYTDLKNKVASEVGVHEITVRRRIAELARLGLIAGNRSGREVYYYNTGIIEV